MGVVLVPSSAAAAAAAKGSWVDIAQVWDRDLLPLWWMWPAAVWCRGGDPASTLGPPLSWVGIGESCLPSRPLLSRPLHTPLARK